MMAQLVDSDQLGFSAKRIFLILIDLEYQSKVSFKI